MNKPKYDELHRVVLSATIYNDKKEFLITKRSDHKKVHPGKWTIPGGGLEVGDYINTEPDSGDGWTGVLEKALAREIEEEVGVKVKEPVLYGNTTFIRPDGIPVLILRYHCEYDSGEVLIDEDATDFAWVPGDKLDEYDLIEGAKKDLKELSNTL